MNEYVPAVLSALAIALPLLANTSIQGRRLRRMQGEAELLATLPEELVVERQLARFSLRQSLWQYTVARSRLSPTRTLVWSFLGVLLFYVALLEMIPFVEQPISLGGWRIPFMLLGAALYAMRRRSSTGSRYRKSCARARHAVPVACRWGITRPRCTREPLRSRGSGSSFSCRKGGASLGAHADSTIAMSS